MSGDPFVHHRGGLRNVAKCVLERRAHRLLSHPMQRLRMLCRTAVASYFCALLAACGEGGDSATETAVFAFRLEGLPASEEFRLSTSSPQLIALARAQLALPVSERRLFVSGSIRAGNGGHNLIWSWHFEDASLVEAAIELCDGRPSMVEANLDYWLNTVKRLCPWDSYVHAELR